MVRTGRWGALALVLMLATGCAALQKALGIKTDLKDKPVVEISATLAGDQALCPGHDGALIVTAILKDGAQLVTEGAGKGKVTWDSYRIETTGAVATPRGVIHMADDPRVSFGQPATYKVTAVDHPGKVFEGQIAARYDCQFVARFSGEPGRDGSDGESGVSGRDGKDEQTSPSYAKPGGSGENGGNGGDGTDGENGRPGDEVQVKVVAVDAPSGGGKLLQVLASSATSNRQMTFLVDPTQGSVVVQANGGRGGDGGRGGNGGRGGRGGTGVPAGNGGSGGDGGRGGNGADGGDGGRIMVVMDPSAQPFAAALVLENGGGRAGNAGSAGSGGSYGTVYSGGTQGRSGRSGQSGSRDGRPGRDGPAPKTVVQSVPPLW